MNLKFFIFYHKNILTFIENISKKHLCTFIIPNWVKRPYKEHEIKYKKIKYKYINFKNKKSITKYNIKQLWKYIEKHDDFVIVKHIFQPINFFIYLICKLKGINVIIYQQKLKEINSKFIVLLIKLFLKVLLPKNARAFSVLKQGYKELKKYFNEVEYIPLPINSKPIHIKKYKNSGNDLDIICVSRLDSRDSDHILLIRALERLQQLYSHIQFNITIVGSFNKENLYYRTLKRIINNSLIKKQIKIIQNMKWVKMIELYRSHDLFILPSYKGPVCYSNIEAMACGLPVIVPNEVGTICYLENKKNGYIFSKNNMDDLIQKIELFITNHSINWDKIKRFGEKSRALALKNHDINKFIDKFEGLLKNCA